MLKQEDNKRESSTGHKTWYFKDAVGVLASITAVEDVVNMIFNLVLLPDGSWRSKHVLTTKSVESVLKKNLATFTEITEEEFSKVAKQYSARLKHKVSLEEAIHPGSYFIA